MQEVAGEDVVAYDLNEGEWEKLLQYPAPQGLEALQRRMLVETFVKQVNDLDGYLTFCQEDPNATLNKDLATKLREKLAPLKRAADSVRTLDEAGCAPLIERGQLERDLLAVVTMRDFIWRHRQFRSPIIS